MLGHQSSIDALTHSAIHTEIILAVRGGHTQWTG